MNGLDIQKAIIYAAKKHEGQKRKGTDIPYIVHPMEVMQILTDINCSIDVVIAGILHDTLEDTTATPEEIRSFFGAEVLKLVQTESEDKSKTWKERKQATIDRIKTASFETCLIALADKLSNIRAMYNDKQLLGDTLFERFNADKNSIAWYYKSVADVLEYKKYEGNGNFSKITSYWKEYSNLVDKVFNI